MKANGRIVFAIVIIVGVASVAAITGCGVKTSPVPPESIPPAAITDLGFSLDQGQATLRWSIPQGRAAGSAGLAGFLVYRAVTPATDPVCDGCPVLFRRIAEMDAEALLAGNPDRKDVTFPQTVDPGYHYIFKVIAYARDGQRGPDSNRVVIK